MAFYAKLKENSIKEMLCACHFHEYCKCYYLIALHVMLKKQFFFQSLWYATNTNKWMIKRGRRAKKNTHTPTWIALLLLHRIFTFILLFGTDLITEIKKNKILRLKWIYFSSLGARKLWQNERKRKQCGKDEGWEWRKKGDWMKMWCLCLCLHAYDTIKLKIP